MNDKTIIKIWITKYALTEGITTEEAEISSNFTGMASVIGSFGDQNFHGEGREWHRTEESAKARAEIMRTAKIGALRKQIAKLEKMEF